MDYLEEGLKKLGFLDGEFFGMKCADFFELKQKLLDYTSLLLEWNKKFDLVNAKNADEIAIRHLLDSLSGARPLCEELFAHGFLDGEIADIGSGAGLPGIALALALPNVKFVLVERMEKRCAFLEECIKKLSIKNAFVKKEQVERLPKGIFFAALFRAFRPLDKKMLKVLLRVLSLNGFLVAYKAKSEKIEAELSALKESLPAHKIVPLFVPFLTEESESNAEKRERNLVIIEKA